jgi:hypothetical protein
MSVDLVRKCSLCHLPSFRTIPEESIHPFFRMRRMRMCWGHYTKVVMESCQDRTMAWLN